MITNMRTTLVIDDYVLKEAKRRAVEVGVSLSELTTIALREALRKREQVGTRSTFVMPTYGSARKQDSSVEAIAELRDEGR